MFTHAYDSYMIHAFPEVTFGLPNMSAVQEEGARSCWLHCFKMAFGSDATDWVE